MTVMDALLGLPITGEEPPTSTAYYVRELTPGWPPGMHPPHPVLNGPEMILIPLDRLQTIGVLLGLAILCLIAITLAIGRKAKARKRS